MSSLDQSTSYDYDWSQCDSYVCLWSDCLRSLDLVAIPKRRLYRRTTSLFVVELFLEHWSNFGQMPFVLSPVIHIGHIRLMASAVLSRQVTSISYFIFHTCDYLDTSASPPIILTYQHWNHGNWTLVQFPLFQCCWKSPQDVDGIARMAVKR